MQKIDIHKIPVIEFDAGIPDPKCDDVYSCATGGTYCEIVGAI